MAGAPSTSGGDRWRRHRLARQACRLDRKARALRRLGCLRASYGSSATAPAPVTPDEPLAYSIELTPSFHTFAAATGPSAARELRVPMVRPQPQPIRTDREPVRAADGDQHGVHGRGFRHACVCRSEPRSANQKPRQRRGNANRAEL